MQRPWQRLLAIVAVALALVWTPALTVPATAAETPRASGTWFETAHATWTGTATGYRAYVRTTGAVDWRDGSPITGWLTDWEEVDADLVRRVDEARNTWRVDVLGLPQGHYEIQVRARNGTTVVHTFTALETRAFPRNGAAFVPSNENPFDGSHDFAPDGAVGGYLPDGRVDPRARVVYVTHDTMASTLPADIFTTGRDGAANQRTPLVIRFLGTLGSFERVAPTPEEAGAVVPPGAQNNNRKMSVGVGNGNVTFEGVGSDAIIYGWGISTGGAHNVVFRNLAFDQFFDDAIEVHGGGTGVRASNIWVHNNEFDYGQNKFLHISDTDPDQAKGDGATDIINHARNYTVSYNHYAGASKVMLVGGGVGSMSPHYGTVHHNWFQGSEERTPRVRHGRVHMFNNLYQDVQGHPHHDVLLERNTGYGIGAAHNATLWAEGNLFDTVNFPFLRSRQGHARGHQAIDYVPGPGESESANAGYNHFFGDAPGFTVTREVVTKGDFPDSVGGFRQLADVMPGLTEEGLAALRADALALEPNVLDAASQRYFDPTLDIGVRVADGSTATNPTMNTNPAQLDWSFRPVRGGVWPTGTSAQAAALRAELETWAGVMKEPAATEAPAAPTIVDVRVNDTEFSVGGRYLPEPRVIVYADTFTIDWRSDDPLADAFEIQWDAGQGTWATLGTVAASARPQTFLTQELDQFGHLIAILASADGPGTYQFRVRALNEVGASAWSTPTSVVVETPASPFTDVPYGSEHFDAIVWMREEGLSTGWPDGTFRPLQPVARDAMVAFLYRLAGSPAVEGELPFVDVVPGQEHYDAILWAHQTGVARGWPDYTFRPLEAIDRNAMMAFMYRYSGSPQYTPPVRSPFSDVAPGDMFYAEITWAHQNGITTGWPDGTFRPLDPTNRDATAAFLYRFAVAGGMSFNSEADR